MDDDTADDILIDCRVADGLLIYRSARDEGLRPAKPLTPGLYVPTDGLRRVSLPAWLGVGAYARSTRPGKAGDGDSARVISPPPLAIAGAAPSPRDALAHGRQAREHGSSGAPG